MTVNCGRGGEDSLDHTTRGGGLDEIGPFGQEAPGANPPGVALQFDSSYHPGGFRRQDVRRTHGTGAIRGGQAASPDGALTSCGSAAFAISTSAVNAAGSLIAISDRFLRSTSTPAALRPWISRL